MNVSEISILCMPLVVILLSIALLPLLAPKFWHKSEIRLFAGVSLFSVVSIYTILPDSATHLLKDALIDDYLPFIIMLFTLFVLSHGIHIKCKGSPTTLVNAGFLGVCSLFSSIIGTTGASMLFLRTYLKLNESRKQQKHLIIFFIFLVSNIGGLLTPLGDPPLLLGYLHGVEFSWELENLIGYWLIYVVLILGIFSVIDKLVLKKDDQKFEYDGLKINIDGWLNIWLILATVFVLFVDFDFKMPLHIPYVCDCIVPHICLKNVILLIFCAISLRNSVLQKEHIDFEPFKEVARTFLVIFIVIAPVLFLLNKHSDDIHKFIIDMSNGSDGSGIIFWLCGAASSFLDNAPSYLLFFNMTGGDAHELMYVYPNVLAAISISSVVMGAMTYIGNAPNMMVKSIAIKRGITMPSFLGYIVWSSLIILPISMLVSLLIS